MRDSARVIGVVWMVVALAVGLFSLLPRVSSPPHYWGQSGIKDAIVISVVLASPGYFLYRWGSKGRKVA